MRARRNGVALRLHRRRGLRVGPVGAATKVPATGSHGWPSSRIPGPLAGREFPSPSDDRASRPRRSPSCVARPRRPARAAVHATIRRSSAPSTTSATTCTRASRWSELAAAAEIDKFRLIRLFRARYRDAAAPLPARAARPARPPAARARRPDRRGRGRHRVRGPEPPAPPLQEGTRPHAGRVRAAVQLIAQTVVPCAENAPSPSWSHLASAGVAVGRLLDRPDDDVADAVAREQPPCHGRDRCVV